MDMENGHMEMRMLNLACGGCGPGGESLGTKRSGIFNQGCGLVLT